MLVLARESGDSGPSPCSSELAGEGEVGCLRPPSLLACPSFRLPSCEVVARMGAASRITVARLLVGVAL